MVKYAILRDDDTSFFTSPRFLEKIYKEIFAMHIPVNLSIIPHVKGNIKTENNMYATSGPRCEPFIPEEYCRENQSFPVYENAELVKFIRDKRGIFEIIQHGFSHSYNEFSSLNLNILRDRLITGRQTLKKAFDVTPKFFAAPYDAYSPISFLLLKKYFHGATFGNLQTKNPLNLRKLPISMIPSYLNAIRRKDTFFFNDSFLVLGHKGLSINPLTNISRFQYDLKDAFQNERVIVITQHYWEYFYIRKEERVGNGINKKLHHGFLEIIQWLKDNGAIFLTLSQLYEKLRG